MSDGALSQEEIDSLLAGLDRRRRRPAAPRRRGGRASRPQEMQAFKAILDGDPRAPSRRTSP